MLIVAHEGHQQSWPWNTLEAVVAAAAAGAEGIEFDIVPSAEGTWFLGRDLAIMGMTDAEVRAERRGGLRIPRVLDVLDALDAYDGVVMLHVKSPAAEDHAEIARLLVDRGLVHRSWVLSHVMAGVEAVKDVEPRIMTGLVGNPLRSPLGSEAVDSWLVNVHSHDWIAALAALVHPDGFVVFVSTDVSEATALEKARRWGAVAFITNRLDDALAWKAHDPGIVLAPR